MEARTVGGLLFLNQDLDPTGWDAAEVRRMASEIERFAPEVIEADPAYLAILARRARLEGIALRAPEVVVLTYEFPSHIHLRQIARAFPGVPVVSSYGSTETGHVFTRCEAGVFHENTATCHVEVQPLRPERSDGRLGRILVTTLENPWFTLVRFDVGDLARLHDGPPCPCGRTRGLAVAAIEGRLRDLTFDGEGRAVSVKRVDDALATVEELLGYQVEQSAPRSYLVRYSAEEGSPADVAAAIASALARVYGEDATIATRREAAIPPEQSGKFRLARTAFAWDAAELFA
jgi:phenylacetate-coenzyme A ligase PaaK-like adenylate-forming protein